MKALFLFLLFVGLSAATPTFVQGKTCLFSTGGSSETCAFAANVAANDLLVVVGRWQNGPTTYTFSSSAGVSCTWGVAVTKFSGNSQSVQVGYCITPSSGAETVQLAFNSSTAFSDMSILEYSGIATSTPLDVAASGAVTNTTACSAGPTAALAGTGELAIGFCGAWDTSQTWGAKSGWTNRTTASSNVLGLYDSVQATASAVTWSYTLSASDQWTAFVVTFKPGAGAPAVARVVPNRIQL